MAGKRKVGSDGSERRSVLASPGMPRPGFDRSFSLAYGRSGSGSLAEPYESGRFASNHVVFLAGDHLLDDLSLLVALPLPVSVDESGVGYLSDGSQVVFASSQVGRVFSLQEHSPGSRPVTLGWALRRVAGEEGLDESGLGSLTRVVAQQLVVLVQAGVLWVEPVSRQVAKVPAIGRTDPTWEL